VSALPLTPPRAAAAMTYAAFPNAPDRVITAPGRFALERNPEAVKAAAILYPDIEAARANAEKLVAAYTALGFRFVYQAAVSVVETNYAPYVLEMRRRGVRYVTAVADYPNISRLAKAMRQQGFRPDLVDWPASGYDPRFPAAAEGAAEGSTLYVNSIPMEERASSPELQRYEHWLAQVAPGARPTFLGLYAWSATALFTEAARRVGPVLTRAALLDQLRAIRAWDGRGVHPAHDVGGKVQSGCVVMVVVRGDRFERLAPSAGYRCDDLHRLGG
jgi:ABC-type branched-subunit amino acid transport system substrate-binding protein